MKKKIFALLLAAIVLTGICAAEEPDALFTLEAAAPYAEMYAELEGGKTLKRGSKGEAAKALQQLLVDLGWELDADGILGNKTFAAMNGAEEAYGLPVTEETADAEAVLPLIRALAVHLYGTDAKDAAGEDFAELYVRDLLRTHRNEEAYAYAAENGLDGLAEECLPPLPENGELFRNSGYRGADAFLVIRVCDVPDERLTVVRLECGNDAVSAVLMKGAGETRLVLPAGEYGVRLTAGDTWFGEGDLLGAAARSFRLDEPLTIEAGREVTLCVNAPDADGLVGYTEE